ncbi:MULTISPECIES: TusE/DsrC/DsvC family sulfur relay protein [Thermodesulfovibrio]|jgi:TusE/DsrC/DsvC family sulfur relay protein|uniref:TusE/DsrC/DsvC family sulfur relay protein n=1 Tax=Thermodesulfovibrio TaxID=28261 RepID=UPI000685D327|nr:MULTISPECIES: TusE/DsrC/DsvC family sulfur relay protein [Thermodesulfovibrio]MDI6864242.1 TusE/DsrC/DsvC family sulfur relay protein [Thermodesulfovibrio yellowstonii]
MAYTIEDLKNKIFEMYPEVKQQSFNVNIYYSEEKQSYIIRFQKGTSELITHLDKQDADDCMNNVKCVYLGVQIGQFIKNFTEKERFEREKPEEVAQYKAIEKTVALDEGGYLKNINDWNEKVAQMIAIKEGVGILTKEQLDIVKFIHEYYKIYNYFPVLSHVCKNINQPKDCIAEKLIDPIVAWKIAGLPKPDDNLINIVKYGVTPT